MFTPNQEEALLDIGGEDFLEDCRKQIRVIRGAASIPDKSDREPAYIRKELASLAEALEGLSCGASNHLWRHKAAITALTAKCREEYNGIPRGTRNTEIGRVVSWLFDDHGLEITSSRSGDFYETLKILLDVAGLGDIDPQALARKIVKLSE